MKRIVCALNCEAEPLRKELVFTDADAEVFVCGVGAKHLPELHADDILINVGVCAGKQIGKLFVCNKIIDQANSQIDKSEGTNKYWKVTSCYPDIPKLDIPQASVATMSKIVTPDMIQGDMLYDQEAATIYRHASRILGPHQMCFIKIVSDAGISVDKQTDFRNLKKHISQLIENNINQILKIIHAMDQINIKPQLETLQTNLVLTETMKNRLKQQYKYSQIAHVDISKFLQINTTNKKESMKILDQIDQVLIEKS